MTKKINYLILFFSLLSLYLTLNFLGIQNLYFNNIDWLLGGSDLSNAQNGWTFFKNDQWHFPLGKNPNYGLDISTSIVFSDSIPLFAFIFKIFRNFLGSNFQYFSLWIFLCFFLQAYIAYLIIYNISKNLSFSIIASLIFLLSPIFIYRLSFHLSLGAHWLLLLGFYVNLKIDDRKKIFFWIFILILSTLIHLYITLFLFGIYSAFLFQKFTEDKNFTKPISQLGLVVLIVLFFMYIFGYFEANVMGSVSRGYGQFKLDLLSIIDPRVEGTENWSSFIPDIQGTSIEGFNYIGIGNISIIFIAFLVFFKKSLTVKNFFKNSLRENIGYITFALVFTAWAISTNVTIAGNEIINIPLPKYIYGFMSIFACTGRFFWPVYYLLIIFSIIFIFKNFKSKHALYILSFSLILQVIDIYPGLKYNFIDRKHLSQPNQLNDKIWKNISENYDNFRTTYLYNNYGPLFDKLSPFIGNSKIKKTDIVLVASLDRSKAAQTRYDFNNLLYEKKIQKNTAYVVDNLGHLKIMKKLLENTNVGFFYRDKLWLALPEKKNEMTKSDIKNLNKIKFEKLKFNYNYKLKFSEKDKLLGVGWSHNRGIEKIGDGVWSEGDVSFIMFAIDDHEEKNLNLKLNFSKYNNNKNKNYKMNIFLNDNLKQEVNLNNYKNNDNLVLKLNKNELKKENILMFKFYNLISPIDVLQSPDARKLGILLKSLLIEAI